MASVGFGADVTRIRSLDLNNPEPEIAVIVTSVRAASSARRSATTRRQPARRRRRPPAGKAKDNNASTALGPFIPPVRRAAPRWTMSAPPRSTSSSTGPKAIASRHQQDDGISPRSTELVRQALSEHQCPDGFAHSWAPCSPGPRPSGRCLRAGARKCSPGLGKKTTINPTASGTRGRLGIRELIATSPDARPAVSDLLGQIKR